MIGLEIVNCETLYSMVESTIDVLIYDDWAQITNDVVQILDASSLIQLHIHRGHQTQLSDVQSKHIDIVLFLTNTIDDAIITIFNNLSEQFLSTPIILVTDSAHQTAITYCFRHQYGHYLSTECTYLLPDLIAQLVNEQSNIKSRMSLIERQNKAFIALSTHPDVVEANWSSALQHITRSTSQTNDISRVSVWFYDEEKTNITCDILYDAKLDTFLSGIKLTAQDYPRYFSAVRENRVIVAHNAHTQPETADFSETYLTPNQIMSLMDVPIRVEGQMVGVVCFEQVQTPRHWTNDDQHFAISIADLIAQTIQNRERHRTEETLRRRERYLKEAEALAHLGNFELNLETNELSWSDECYRIHGLDVQSGISLERFRKVIGDEAFNIISSAVEKTIQSKTTYKIEYEVTFDDGMKRQLFAIGRPTLSADDRVIRVFGIVQDITQRKQVEQQRVELELHQQKIAFLQDFIDSMIHDMKTPLSGINSIIYMLRRLSDDDKILNYLDRLHKHSSRIHAMVDNILMVSRLENLPEMTYTEHDLNQIVQDAVNTLQPIADNKNITVDLQLWSEPLLVMISKNEFIRAVLNLVENALNYTPDNGRISIRILYSSDTIILEIQDSGIGIPQNDLPRVFEQFYRSEHARQFGNGTGLGLAIVKKIIELHNGTIHVKSVVDEGTTVTVKL